VEPLGVGTEDGRIELVATHNEDRFVRDRRSSDSGVGSVGMATSLPRARSPAGHQRISHRVRTTV
jgi:hypothetical protein